MTREIDYRLVVDAAPALIFSARPDGYVDYFNRRWRDWLGVSLDVLADERWTGFIHPEDLDDHLRRWRVGVAHGQPCVSQARVRTVDGEYRWMLHRTEPLFDDAGQVVRWFGTSIDIEELKRTERELQELKEQLHKENIALRDEISQTSMSEEIIGSSTPLRQVLGLVAKVAVTDSLVLISGETGTGKELIARAIHRRSPRAARAFVCLNCGAIPPSLMASELFGHEKGAFTGAMQRRFGRFELAEGGTIFLDEVGELPLETQAALLRVLQEHTFERVGGSATITADVRVIAATNRDLLKATADGTFREDLYYRLSVFPIHSPPLRARGEDIPLLVEYFAQRYARNSGKTITAVSRSTMDRLCAYDWPGNIRELQNIIQRAVILADHTLTVDETWLQQRQPPRETGLQPLARPSAAEEMAMIKSALATSRGRVSGPDGAAAKLGVPRSTLESRIRALRIDKHRFKSE